MDVQRKLFSDTKRKQSHTPRRTAQQSQKNNRGYPTSLAQCHAFPDWPILLTNIRILYSTCADSGLLFVISKFWPRASSVYLIQVSDPAPDPDPALFVSDFQDANKKILFLLSCVFLKKQLHHSSKIKSHKEVSRNQGFSHFLVCCGRIRIRICTNKLWIWMRSRKPKNIGYGLGTLPVTIFRKEVSLSPRPLKCSRKFYFRQEWCGMGP